MNVAEKEKIFEELDIVLLTQPFETSHPNMSGDWKITSPTIPTKVNLLLYCI